MSKSKSSSSSSGAAAEKPVELGFIEEESTFWKLSSAYFVSKVGGQPAWLNLKELPSVAEMKCPSCDFPTQFLMQVYAPLDENETFHRTIFIFICSRKMCCVERNSNKNLLVFRCQLPRDNEFYSKDPPNLENKELAEISPEKFGVTLCRMCGCRGNMKCSACKKVSYCSKDHQQFDWKMFHKKECTDPDFKGGMHDELIGFQEFELVMDTEVIPKGNAKKKIDEKTQLEEYKKLVADGKAGSLEDSEVSKDMLEASSYKSDKAFNKFKKRIAYQPAQVLRYDRAGEPLWVSNEKAIEKSDVPPCSYCKGPRVFEFQVMPQLLNDLGNEVIDWGTLAVYTCVKSCNLGPAYKSEFIWQQDFKMDEEDGSAVSKKMKKMSLNDED
ncbi:Programmed cell death protein 2 [Orchesella cincta]|uniref:Programmed cell death protein 2 n=1 Tax=Orchesella cincta TaxID=48709 RepID=A0A1D2NAA6_ORCCI|nr:Programmed cell death protein 2 [Orchesella cincta]